MIKINKDISFLSQKAETANASDLDIALKLKEALIENKAGCVGISEYDWL